MLHYSDYIFFTAALALPLVIGLFIVIKFWNDELSRYMGFLSLKPVFTVLVWFLVPVSYLYDSLNNIYPLTTLTAYLWFIPELMLTLVIVYSFRYLFNKNSLVWKFLIGDMIRWLSIFVIELIPDPNPEPYFYLQLYIWAFFMVLFPSLYAILGFVAVRKRTNSQNVAH